MKCDLYIKTQKGRIDLKKLVVLLTVLVLAFGVAACGGSNNTSESLEIEKDAKLIIWESGGGSEEEFMKYAAEEFIKLHPGVTIEFQAVGHTDAAGKLAVDGPAGLGADVFAAPHDKVGELVAGSLVAENYFPEEYKANYLKAAIDGTTYTGTLYGYPVAIETYALFYNKDLVAEADLPKTWDDVITLSKAFQNYEENKYGLMADVGNFYFMYAFIGGFGGYVFGDGNTDKTDVGLNNSGAIEAGEFLRTLRAEILPLNKADLSSAAKETAFKEGRLLFELNGPWATQGYKDTEGLNFGVIPFPKLSNGEVPTSFSGVRSLFVSSFSKYPNAAHEFAKFASSKELLEKRFEITSQIPVHADLVDSAAIQGDEYASAFLAQAAYAVPMPNIPDMGNVWGPMATALEVIWDKPESEATVKDTLDTAVQAIKDIIGQ